MEERSNPELSSLINNNILARFAYPLEVDTSPPSSSFMRFSNNSRDRSISSCSLNYRGSPYNLSVLSPDQPPRRNSDPSSLLMAATPYSLSMVPAMIPSSPSISSDYEDQPLDMSKKSRRASDVESHDQVDCARSVGNTCTPSSSSSSSSPYDTINLTMKQQQSRPSVITCAPRKSTVYEERRNSVHDFNPTNTYNNNIDNHHMHSSSSSSSSYSPSSAFNRSATTNSILSKCLTGYNNNNNNDHHMNNINGDLLSKWREDIHRNRPSDEEIVTSNKLLLLKEDCAPGIDEHFRRSLGEHYTGYTDVSLSGE